MDEAADPVAGGVVVAAVLVAVVDRPQKAVGLLPRNVAEATDLLKSGSVRKVVSDPQKGERPEGRERRGRPAGGGPEGQPAGQGYELDPLVGLDQERFPLRSKLLANPTLKTRYLQYVRMIASDYLAWEKMEPRVASAKELIESEVKADTRKLMTMEGFELATNLASPAKARSLREFAEKRSAYLLNHPAIKDLPAEFVTLPSKAKKKK